VKTGWVLVTEQMNNPYEKPKANLISTIKRRLSWFDRRTYKKIVDVAPQSNDMAAFQKLYKEVYELGDTLHIRVDVSKSGVHVPMQYDQDGEITLDISPRAIAKFQWTSDGLKFKAKFSGRARIVEVPFLSLLAMYNLETQLGAEFGSKEDRGQ
jgi:hypothetical protein